MLRESCVFICIITGRNRHSSGSSNTIDSQWWSSVHFIYSSPCKTHPLICIFMQMCPPIRDDMQTVPGKHNQICFILGECMQYDKCRYPFEVVIDRKNTRHKATPNYVFSIYIHVMLCYVQFIMSSPLICLDWNLHIVLYFKSKKVDTAMKYRLFPLLQLFVSPNQLHTSFFQSIYWVSAALSCRFISIFRLIPFISQLFHQVFSPSAYSNHVRSACYILIYSRTDTNLLNFYQDLIFCYYYKLNSCFVFFILWKNPIDINVFFCVWCVCCCCCCWRFYYALNVFKSVDCIACVSLYQ